MQRVCSTSLPKNLETIDCAVQFVVFMFQPRVYSCLALGTVVVKTLTFELQIATTVCDLNVYLSWSELEAIVYVNAWRGQDIGL